MLCAPDEFMPLLDTLLRFACAPCCSRHSPPTELNRTDPIPSDPIRTDRQPK